MQNEGLAFGIEDEDILVLLCQSAAVKCVFAAIICIREVIGVGR